MGILDSSARLIVFFEPGQPIGRLFRIAQRRAKALGVEWEVIALETRSNLRIMTPDEKEEYLQFLTMARQMGAIVSQVFAVTSLKAALQAVSYREGKGITITSIKMGVERQSWLMKRLRPSLAYRLQQVLSPRIRVSLIPITSDIVYDNKFMRVLSVNLNEILQSILAVAMATLCIQLVNYFWPHTIFTYQHHNKAIIYMIACAYAAGRFGLFAGVIAAVASFFTMGMIYVAPYAPVAIKGVHDLVNLGLFLLSSIVMAYFGGRQHSAYEIMFKRAERFESLLQLHHMTLNQKNVREAIALLNSELSKLLGATITFFLPNAVQPNRLEMVQQSDIILEALDLKALEVCWDECKTTGVGSPYNPGGSWRFEPLITNSGEIGVLGVLITKEIVMDTSFSKLLSSIADQAALILERLELGHIAEENRVKAEREKLRAMLLSSVSHDLKTPLASVIGSLSVFRSMQEKLPEEQRKTLINTALEEAQRLDSFITNILDMTRIESGQIEMRQEWEKPEMMVQHVLKRLRDRLKEHRVVVSPPAETLEVLADGIMSEQVLQNILDNAGKYTPAGTVIEIRWYGREDGFYLTVRDEGPGIPEEKLHTIFDKYERIHREDSQVAGTGLGLAISRAVMQSQGGRVDVANHENGGAVFTLFLPQWRSNIAAIQEVA